MDVNCRITAFRLFKDFINSNKKFTGDSIDLNVDLDTIMNNKDAKFSTKDVENLSTSFLQYQLKIQMIQSKLQNK